ncbi:MAG TPA: GatB/YqeY domain-containing protein, partial [Terriglobia bacterium]|nr:GatB/YqeY domain-containing protein [Terriglobia bacterium]
MSLQDTIQAHIADAMRSKDVLKLGVLRMMKTAVKNKEVEK